MEKPHLLQRKSGKAFPLFLLRLTFFFHLCPDGSDILCCRPKSIQHIHDKRCQNSSYSKRQCSIEPSGDRRRFIKTCDSKHSKYEKPDSRQQFRRKLYVMRSARLLKKVFSLIKFPIRIPEQIAPLRQKWHDHPNKQHKQDGFQWP